MKKPKRPTEITGVYRWPQKSHHPCNAACKDRGAAGHGEDIRGLKHIGGVPVKTYRRAPNGPSTDELRKILHSVLEEYKPKSLRTELQAYFEDKDVGYLIWTPPYCPDLQPIELLWAYVKTRVAKDWFKGRKLRALFDQLMNAFYGGKKHGLEEEWKPVDAEFCGKIIGHAQKKGNWRITHDPLLSGMLGVTEGAQKFTLAEGAPLEGGSVDGLDLPEEEFDLDEINVEYDPEEVE